MLPLDAYWLGVVAAFFAGLIVGLTAEQHRKPKGPVFEHDFTKGPIPGDKFSAWTRDGIIILGPEYELAITRKDDKKEAK